MAPENLRRDVEHELIDETGLQQRTIQRRACFDQRVVDAQCSEPLERHGEREPAAGAIDAFDL